jgi:carbamoyltransferase
MIVLGLAGGFDFAAENDFDLPFDGYHDSAAVLVRDGEVVAGIEEERLNRIKHTNKAPSRAARFCLEYAGIKPAQLDGVAFYETEPFFERELQRRHLADPGRRELFTPRAMIQRLFRREFGAEIEADRIHFVDHHLAHAVSAYAMSGFDDALVVTLDGQGNGVSGAVYDGDGPELKSLRRMPIQDSLGFLYWEVIRFLGYELFDEYKVMGMAPYGDPERFRDLFGTFYELLPDGEYRIYRDRVFELFRVARPRRRGEEFTREHQDIAAAVQEATEQIGLHVLDHFRHATGRSRLCLAGGVAHNCSLNRKVLYSGLFEQIFVQPAAHDAGGALGAALEVHDQLQPAERLVPTQHVYWGSSLASDDALGALLARWRDFIEAQQSLGIVERAADLLAAGQVIGWVQGRSEFGPRALGNRSILADPRPAENKDIINRMVKKREGYRPFAPSVPREDVDRYFVTTAAQKDFPYMGIVLDVRPEWRDGLAAVTHVDGTARVQTVARDTNPRYWELLRTFGDRAGVSVLLNTSFNNHAEPIVNSARDAVVCFLTTDLNALVIGDWLIRKRVADPDAWQQLRVRLPEAVALSAERDACRHNGSDWMYQVRFAHHHGRSTQISLNCYRLLAEADGELSIGDFSRRAEQSAAETEDLVSELRSLWSDRFVELDPPR